jgi:hypothetical protein
MYSVFDALIRFEYITQKLKLVCADSHATFQHPTSLWKNEKFIAKLSFKLNEDINPTKTTHLGMTPDDLNLAKEECSQLLKLSLIELTLSNWAC